MIRSEHVRSLVLLLSVIVFMLSIVPSVSALPLLDPEVSGPCFVACRQKYQCARSSESCKSGLEACFQVCRDKLLSNPR